MASDQSGVIYVNGRFDPADIAAVSVFDHGLLYGDGVFDTMVATNGYVFKLEAHVDRLFRSLKAVQLAIPLSPDDMKSAILDTVRANKLKDAYIKVVITRGVSSEPLLDPRGCVPTIVIFARPRLNWASTSQRTHGLRAKVVNIRRVSMDALEPRVKSLNYLNFVLAKLEAIDAGYDEALLADHDGYVCEAPGYNVFAVYHGHVATPIHGVLEGITRETILDLCHRHDLNCGVARLAPYDLYVADEVFLSSTAADLVPVVEIDGRAIGSGTPGPIFSMLAREYAEMLSSGECGTSI